MYDQNEMKCGHEVWLRSLAKYTFWTLYAVLSFYSQNWLNLLVDDHQCDDISPQNWKQETTSTGWQRMVLPNFFIFLKLIFLCDVT
jgi:hypothetical protein